MGMLLGRMRHSQQHPGWLQHHCQKLPSGKLQGLPCLKIGYYQYMICVDTRQVQAHLKHLLKITA